MARKLRRDFVGAWHHVMNRSACDRAIFKTERDCLSFLGILEEATRKFDIEIHLFSLMLTHYHLFARSIFGNLSKAMQFLESKYALQFNLRHGMNGPLFRDRFKNKIVGNVAYQRYLTAYIHLNPVKANPDIQPEEARWTSHRAYLGIDVPPSWLTTSYLLKVFGGPKHLDRYVRKVRSGRQSKPQGFDPDRWQQEDDPGAKSILDESFLPLFEEKPSRNPRTQPRRDALIAIQQITGSDLAELRISVRGRGANPARRFAAWALFHSTLLSMREVAEILWMPYGQVASLISRMRNGPVGSNIQDWIEEWRARENAKCNTPTP